MAKKQESYELMTVFSLKNGEEAAKELVEKFREKIASSATLDEVNEWGKRKLAYPINDEPDGYYTLYTFTSTPDVPAEVERVLNITDGVLRSLVTVKSDQFQKGKRYAEESDFDGTALCGSGFPADTERRRCLPHPCGSGSALFQQTDRRTGS